MVFFFVLVCIHFFRHSVMWNQIQRPPPKMRNYDRNWKERTRRINHFFKFRNLLTTGIISMHYFIVIVMVVKYRLQWARHVHWIWNTRNTDTVLWRNVLEEKMGRDFLNQELFICSPQHEFILYVEFSGKYSQTSIHHVWRDCKK
jgi:hypothetical protein